MTAHDEEVATRLVTDLLGTGIAHLCSACSTCQPSAACRDAGSYGVRDLSENWLPAQSQATCVDSLPGGWADGDAGEVSNVGTG